MPGKEKLIGVQYLRAIAALMVVYCHLIGQVPAFSSEFSFKGIADSRHLSSGVYIFFVISGFIMYVTGRKLSAREFAWRRLVRIVPLYWLVTFAVCAVSVLDPSGLHRTDITAEYVAKSILFIPYANPTQGRVLYPILVPGWSLNYEMFFYAIFTAALFAPARIRMWLVVGVICVAASFGVAHPRPEMSDVYGFYTSTHLMLFAAGIGLGALYIWLRDARVRLPRWAYGATVVIGFWVLLADFQLPEVARLAQFVGSMAIVAGTVGWECQYGMPRSRLMLLLGDASYSIYLVHIFAFGLVRQLWNHVPLRGTAGGVAFGIVSVAAAIGIALVTYRLIEQQSLALFNHFRQRRRGGAVVLDAPT